MTPARPMSEIVSYPEAENMPESFDKSPAPAAKATVKPKRESFLANILLNIVIPAVIPSKLRNAQYLGPPWVVVAALSCPLGDGIRDFFRTRKINVFSALGFISILLTGGISLL